MKHFLPSEPGGHKRPRYAREDTYYNPEREIRVCRERLQDCERALTTRNRQLDDCEQKLFRCEQSLHERIHRLKQREKESRTFYLDKVKEKDKYIAELQQKIVQVQKETELKVQQENKRIKKLCRITFQNQEERHQHQMLEIQRKLQPVSPPSSSEDVHSGPKIDFKKQLFVVHLTDANKRCFAPLSIHTKQFLKQINTGKSICFKFVFLHMEDETMCSVHDVDVTHLEDAEKFKKIVKNGIRRKNAQKASSIDRKYFRTQCRASGISNLRQQREWDKTFYFRWSDSYARKGDLRAKMSTDFLSSGQFYDEELEPAIISELNSIRGSLHRDAPSRCFYCDDPATEDDHYMSRVRNNAINKYLDCEINLVPSCSGCNRHAGKDNKGSFENPLDWWLDINQKLRQKHPAHPQNKMGTLTLDRRQRLESVVILTRIQRFSDFFQRYAPRLPEDYWNTSKQGIETVLDNTFDFFLSQLTDFDEKDKEIFQEGLISAINEKYKRDH